MNGSARADVDDVLTLLLADLRAALGDRLVALYLYGSVVSGGFDPGISDVDLVAVVEGRVEELDLAALDAVHRRVIERDARWADRLEIVYAARQTLAELRPDDELAVISPGEAFHLTGPAVDWLGNWYLVRQAGVTLTGPPAADLIAPISRARFLQAVERYLVYLRGVDSPGYEVLSACRAICTLNTGKACSKQEGASWARARMPEWEWLIDAALAHRLSRGKTGFSGERDRSAARAFVDLMARRSQSGS